MSGPCRAQCVNMCRPCVVHVSTSDTPRSIPLVLVSSLTLGFGGFLKAPADRNDGDSEETDERSVTGDCPDRVHAVRVD